MSNAFLVASRQPWRRLTAPLTLVRLAYPPVRRSTSLRARTCGALTASRHAERTAPRALKVQLGTNRFASTLSAYFRQSRDTFIACAHYSQPCGVGVCLRPFRCLLRYSMDSSLDGRNSNKRKQPPSSSERTPRKRRLREQRFEMATTNGNVAHSPTLAEDDASLSPALSPGADKYASEDDLQIPAVALTETKEWQAVIERVVKSVVSIHFCQTASFDTDQAMSSEATGFVVDAEKGYILTNRHVVCAGPFSGFCIFDNHEETDVFPVYRDPVHDFGFLRFDPKAIKYMPLEALTLRPDQAKVGVEIRVVGNDAGEKLSILSGVISRLDRNAPEYDGYSDFNTNYIQAAASASGGSSGSPVVNLDGNAVALQAGGRADGASTDYFLPLDRPARALELIQHGKQVPRGTIQTQWLLKPYDECRRLGLTADWEAAVRKQFPKETGMLVAEVVLPEGPADSKLQEGDVLIKVDGELLTQFVRLDDTLDSNVGGKTQLLVQRGGKDVSIEVSIGDLHAITPDRYVSVCGAAFHNLSYQQARLYAVAVRGLYVCEASGSFKFESLESGWIITSIDNKDTPNLDAFIEVMKGIKDRARVVVTYKHLRDLHTHNTNILFIDRHWVPKMTMAIRNDESGIWDFKDLADPVPAVTPEPREASFISMQGVQHPAAADIVNSFVRVTVVLPIKLDGFPRSRKVGFGLVIDAEQGLVVVSRAIVPYDLCDVSVTIADSIIVDAKILFLHPLQNYAIIKYDPSLVKAPVKSARLATEMVKQGAKTLFFAYNANLRPVVAETSITDITTVAIPASSATPRYRAINLDAITVDSGLSSQCGSGALLAEDGTVQALWLTYLGERSPHSGKDIEYHLGLATPMILPVIQQIKGGIKPKLRILNVETSTMHMSQARIMGLDEEWIKRVERENPERHQLFMVRKVDAGHDDALQEGDLILTINGKLVTKVTDMDDMYTMDTLDTLVLRKRAELRLQVPTVPTEEMDTDRAVIFCGAILHRPHHAVRQQIRKVHSDVYISGRIHGSPAYMYGLAPTNFIMAVNDVKTPDLTAFVEQVNKIPDNTYFRLRVVTFDNVPWVATLKKNEHYFPTMEFIKDRKNPSAEPEWRRITYDHGKPHEGVEHFEATIVDQGSGGVEAG